MSKFTKPLESATRKKIDQMLINLGWNVDEDDPNCNVFTERAKTYEPKKEKYYSQFPTVKFETIMKENTKTIKIDDNKEYTRITVKLHGQGIVLRDKIFGKKIKTKTQKVTKADQFIVAELDAKFGAFGVIPKELEGAIVSSHYWLFDLDTNKLIPEYFDYVIRYGPYENIIKPSVKGTTNYAAPRPKHILSMQLPLPTDKDVQKDIVNKLNEQLEIKYEATTKFNQLLTQLIIEPSFKQTGSNIKTTVKSVILSDKESPDLRKYMK
ncbi:MAG: hypothetical protein FJ360_00710 [Thaumarchaeota archaeon]|nr:hypothetical protein [Nitrososphaerota archaeon]